MISIYSKARKVKLSTLAATKADFGQASSANIATLFSWASYLLTVDRYNVSFVRGFASETIAEQ